MSLVWISKPVILHVEEEAMTFSAFYFCICTCLCCCPNFNPSWCYLLPSNLTYQYVALPRSCRLSEFYPITWPHLLFNCLFLLPGKYNYVKFNSHSRISWMQKLIWVSPRKWDSGTFWRVLQNLLLNKQPLCFYREGVPWGQWDF